MGTYSNLLSLSWVCFRFQCLHLCRAAFLANHVRSRWPLPSVQRQQLSSSSTHPTIQTFHLPFATATDACSDDDDGGNTLTSISSTTTLLDEIDNTVENVLNEFRQDDDVPNILSIDPSQREVLGTAQALQNRLNKLKRNGDCKRCWMQQKHCFCSQCPPITDMLSLPSFVGRIFFLIHRKEIGLLVDTARIVWMAYPTQVRMVVAGIPSKYQPSMLEMEKAMMMHHEPDDPSAKKRCMVLYPSDDAMTFDELMMREFNRSSRSIQEKEDEDEKKQPWDIIVIDGTWAQARKMAKRYIPSKDGPHRVKLSDTAVESLRRQEGHQMRRHPIDWRNVATLEAVRLLLQDIDPNTPALGILKDYHERATPAIKRQLGPPRVA